MDGSIEASDGVDDFLANDIAEEDSCNAARYTLVELDAFEDGAVARFLELLRDEVLVVSDIVLAVPRSIREFLDESRDGRTGEGCGKSLLVLVRIVLPKEEFCFGRARVDEALVPLRTLPASDPERQTV